MNLKGKVAVITGAAAGIGKGCAVKFAQCGADLALLDLSMEKLETVKAGLAAYPVKVETYVCDVSDETAVNETAEQITADFGKVDILVNNAALWRDFRPFAEVPTEVWRKMLDINVLGVMFMTRAFLDGMIGRKYGRVINVASVAGVYGNANMVCYSATKAAVIAMTRALAKETAKDNVLINCVSPGSVSPSENGDVDYVEPSELCFMGRTGSDMENANLICFLASDEASYISAQNIQIDGCRRKQ